MGVYIIAGNKGGVGKSTISMLMADYIARQGKSDGLLCGDAEMSELQRTFGSQMKAAGIVGSDRVRAYNFMTDEGVEAFIDDMAGHGGTAIIDTGANIQGYMTKQAGFLSDCLREAGADATIVFVVSPADESAAALQDFLMALSGTDLRLRVVLMGPEDIPVSEYALFRNPLYDGTRLVLEGLGCPIHFIGQIPERFFQLMMRGERKLPAKIMEDLEGKAMKRRFAGWLAEKVDPIMSEILGESDARPE